MCLSVRVKLLLFLLAFSLRGHVEATLNRPADDVVVSPPDPDLNIKVGCYYYPWHFDDFHRGERYLRDYLDPRQEPSLGEYNDRDPEIIKQHAKMSRQANCRVWIAAWFGIGSREDLTLLGATLPTLFDYDPDQRVAIHYESNALIRKKDNDNVFDDSDHYWTVDEVPGHIEHMCQKYFSHPNYYTVEGERPVIFVYLTRTLDNERPKIDENGMPSQWDTNELLEALIGTMRTAAMEVCGKDLFIVGDHVFNNYNEDRDDPAMKLLDAITG